MQHGTTWNNIAPVAGQFTPSTWAIKCNKTCAHMELARWDNDGPSCCLATSVPGGQWCLSNRELSILSSQLQPPPPPRSSP